MRIEKLNLNRYGHFTDFELDFTHSNSSDLHIVYGPNEAGKSTILSAIVDLLFGIPQRSAYSFLHDYKIMEIDARLKQQDTTLNIKRFKNSLTNDHNQKIPESSIDLHGFNRDDFRSRFSFDEAELEKGGEAILGNNGDLGAALFSATSGIADFSSAIEALLKPHDQFYKPRTKLNQLKELKDSLKTIDERRNEIDINASSWAKQIDQTESARTAYTAQQNKTNERQQLLDKLKSHKQALLVKQRIDDINNKLASYSNLPEVPATWLIRSRELAELKNSADAQSQSIAKQIEEIDKNILRIKVDKNILAEFESIKHLKNELALYLQRKSSLETLSNEIQQASTRLDRLRTQINLPTDTADLSQDTIANLYGLIKESTSIESNLDNANEELEKANTALNVIGFDESTKTTNIDSLQSLIAGIRQRGQSVELRQLNTSASDLQNELQQRLSELNPWTGNLKQLQSLKIPGKALVEKLAGNQLDSEQSLNLVEKQIKATEKEYQELQKKISSANSEDNTYSLTGLIKQRDEEWDKHVSAVDNEETYQTIQKTARIYSLSQQQLDNAYSEAIKTAQKQGALDLAEAQEIDLQKKFRELENSKKQRTQDVQSVLSDLAAIAESLGLNKNYSSAEIIQWMEKREDCIGLIVKTDQITKEIEELKSQISSDQEKILSIIQNTADTEHVSKLGFDDLLDYADNLIENTTKNNNKIEQSKTQFTTAQLQLTTRQETKNKAEERKAAWLNNWSNQLENTWISERDPIIIETMLETVSELQKVQGAFDSKLAEKDVVEKQLSQYKKNAEEIFDATHFSKNAEVSGASFASKINTLHSSALENQTAASLLENLKNQKNDLAAELSKATSASAPVANELLAMTEACKASDLFSLQATLEKIDERNKLKSSLQEHHSELVIVMEMDTAESALNELALTNSTEITTKISELELELKSDKTTLEELHHEFRSIQDKLDNFQSNSEVADLAQERQNILLQIETQALLAAEARLGNLALQQAINHFRDKNRSGMLNHARETFSTITCGNYIDLRTQPSEKKQGEDLVGITASGQSKLAANMSSGTRAQLYLALRVAAYKEYCETRQPLPFIADDIMETFDDQRTEATLEVLADMAKQGQIIYLTHHKHVLDIASALLKEQAKVHKIDRTGNKNKESSNTTIA